MQDKNRFLVVGMLVGLFGLAFVGSASALTYQEEIPVSFTFNRGLSLSVSASDLHIYNLTPGTSDDSNIITVTTTTNNVTGYSLTASVGSSTNASTNLVNGTNNFASIATNANLASLTTDNTWGYSISTNNGSTWSNYSGLPIYTASSWKELVGVNTNGTTSIKFKIGAKASAAQAAGDYTNVINFTATANYVPYTIDNMYYMQDFANLSSTELTNVLSSMTQNTQYTLKDSRDQQDYTIAKLSDGNVWMTKNLNLAGGTTVTAADTNATADYTLPLSDATGFSSGGSVFNSNSTICSSTDPCYSYYSASVAELLYDNIVHGNVCSKGWKIPSQTEWESLTSIYSTGTTLTANPFQATYAGYLYNGGFNNGGTNGYYLTSTTGRMGRVGIQFDSTSTDIYAPSITGSDFPPHGFSIRCIVEQ